MTIAYADTDLSWVYDLNHIFMYGSKTKPRGMMVYEMIGYQSIIYMDNPIIFNPHRNLGYKFMAAEAAWILSGSNRVSEIAPYSKDISKFSDNGETFFGAYGPPITEQFMYVVDALINDRDTRQAVLTIWRQNPPITKDVPCTVSLQFLIRDNLLHCVANMRSSDLWLGHPYDIFNFSAVSFAVLLALSKFTNTESIKLGRLFLNAGSKHLYERNIEAVSFLLAQDPVPVNRKAIFNAKKYDGKVTKFIEHLWDCANSEKGALSLME